MPPRRVNQATSPSPEISHDKQRPDEDTHTPEQSPAKQGPTGITQAQKQALIDNLQLEITERARKLRAQYALQAQGLRSRLEMRINRIPQALRKRKIQDLLDEHEQAAKPQSVPAAPSRQAEAIARQSTKRKSDSISNDADDNKENDTSTLASSQPIANPKKRAKPNTSTTTANTKATRTASRKDTVAVATSTAPSPKSYNSVTLPRSPFKTSHLSPAKTHSRPLSPAKPSIAASRTASRQQPASQVPGKRTKAGPKKDEGRTSEGSTTSSVTTVVTKPSARSKADPATTAAKTGTAARSTTRKPVAAAQVKKENMPPVAVGGGRSLRKRT